MKIAQAFFLSRNHNLIAGGTRGNVARQCAGQKGKTPWRNAFLDIRSRAIGNSGITNQTSSKRQLLRLRLLAEEEKAELGKRPRWRRLKLRLKRMAADLLT